MYQILLIFALAILSAETTKSLESEAKILDYKNSNDGLGNYFFSFHTSNGIIREETGRLVNSGLSDEYISVEGFYSYPDEDGNIRTVNYTADTNGYVIKEPISDEFNLQGPPAAVPGPVIASLLGR